MTRKIQVISELAGRTAHEVTRDADSWKRYLDTASRLYKYSFDDQLLIYAQRPDATACAAMELWNEKMRRWVKAGSKGIALIRDSGNGRPHLEYVFDVADTRAVRGAKMPYLWEMRGEHHAPVLAALGARPNADGAQGLGDCLMETAARAADEVYAECLHDMAYDTGEDLPGEPDRQDMEADFRRILTASVQYTLLVRCGLEPSDYLDDGALEGIRAFSTPAALHHLGDAASRLSMGILQEIGRTIRAYDREQLRNPQKKLEKPLEKTQNIGYTKDTEHFNTLKHESKERSSNDDRTDIHEKWGLPDTGSDDGRGGHDGGDAVREVRAAAAELPQGTAPRDVHVDAADRTADAAPVPDRPAGAGADRQDGGGDDAVKRSGRGAQGARPDGVAPGSEQLHGAGGGSGAAGDRVPLDQTDEKEQANHKEERTAGDEPAVSAFQLSLFPTVEEQAERIAGIQAGGRQIKIAAPLSGVAESVTARALTSGSNNKDSILRIVAFFQKSPSLSDAAAFLSKEYGTGGKGLSIAGSDYALWSDEKGIRIAQGHTADIPGSTLVPWEKAAALVQGLLESGTYAAQEKLDAARDNEYRELAQKLWYLRQDLSDEAKEAELMPQVSALYGLPDGVERIAGLLKEKEERDAVMAELSVFNDAYRKKPELLRFRKIHDPQALAGRIAALDLPQKEFTAMDGFSPVKGSFVTEDETDHMLSGGSGVSEGKMRIYAYFMQGHDAKECAAFLRSEYGDGGRGQTGYNEWHDSKGIRFTRSDEHSGYDGYDTIKMNWNQVQKRIHGLIDAGKYLTAEEQAYTAEYEKLQLAQKLYAFFYHDPRVKLKKQWNISDAERDFRPLLDSPKYCESLYEDMVEVFALMSPEDGRTYRIMEDAIESMAAFQRGEYSLFSPLPEEKLQAERMERGAAKQAQKEKSSKTTVEKEPAGELEAAARALAKKQKGKITQRPDGQLAFNFSAVNMEESQKPEGQETVLKESSETKTPEKEESEPGMSKTGAPEPVISEEEVSFQTVPERAVLIAGESGASEKAVSAAEESDAGERAVPTAETSDTKERAVPTAEMSDTKERAALTAEKNDAKIIAVLGTEDSGSKEKAVSETKESAVSEKAVPATEKGTVKFVESGEITPAALYRKTLSNLIETVRQSGMYDYLHGIDYESAFSELDAELDYYIDVLEESRPEEYHAFQSLPKFRQWMVEDILEYTCHDLPDGMDAISRHAGEPDLPKWAVEDAAEPVQEAGISTDRSDKQEPAVITDNPDESEAGVSTDRLDKPEEEQNVPESGKQGDISLEEPDLVPNVEEYLNLKVQYQDKLAGVKVGGFYLFYGKDAQEAAAALGTKTVIREIPGLGETSVTGVESWQSTMKKLLEHGQSVVIAEPEPEHGDNPAYGIVKECDIADYIPLKMQLTIDGRHMEIDSVDYVDGHVSLRDMDLKGWFPVFRKEPVSFVRDCVERELENQRENELSLSERSGQKSIQQSKAVQSQAEPESVEAADMEVAGVGEFEGGQVVASETESVYDKGLPYEIVVEKLHFGAERHNYHITDDSMGAGGQKTRFQNNIAAVETLKQIESENRTATPGEQEILAKYVGWGGIAQAFDPKNPKWAKEYEQLKTILTPEEYESARSTVLNAHYTSPVIIKAVYEAVGAVDFTPGNILEPSCGIGNFFGLVPEKYKDSSLYGVELDSLTGRIAKQLYQKADITISGFEKTQHPDDFFDLAIGNVPFGEYKVHDSRYDRQNLLIHDYFLTKALDKVRPGGVAAFITSKGTLDKADSRVREALAQKADLLGAIRLPNNAFKASAGTDVTSDILFFQKRGSAPAKLPDWVHTGKTEDGVPVNNYYLAHPDMVLGKMSFWENMYGNKTETACLPIEGAALAQQLAEAVQHISRPDQALLHMDAPDREENEQQESIPADPGIRNFSYTEKDGKLYFRENSRMTRTEQGKTQTARIKGMIGIRDSARKLIDLQLSGAGEEEIQSEQARLNSLYDSFQKKYGLLNSAGNRLAFRQDSSYPLLCSLEVLDEEGNFKRKADMFSRRTIQHRKPVTSVDTAVEALGVSIGERACVDLDFMASLMGGNDESRRETITRIVSDLRGIIFKDPATGPFDIPAEDDSSWKEGWQTADEYLSGNVRQKLETARRAAEEYPEFAVNVEALEKVQPRDLTAPEISVRIGAPWIDTKYYKEFLFQLLQTPQFLQDEKIDVMYSDTTGEWRVKGKQEDSRTNTRVWNTYGTKRVNAYEIFESSLNQRSVQIFDTHRDMDGKESRVLNEKETAVAQQKQDALKEAFQDWIFKDPDRRAGLCATYNQLFNATRPREYDGQHINFIGMNPEIRLEKHQRNAVARILYGGNTLLAHVVGAGKTFEMVAAAMESKRLGLCKKSMIVVPNHLTEQWGGDFLTLYPGANVLVATKKDFEPKNRKKFCARISTGDYDAVIIGHSQFEKIPISPERQEAVMEAQIDEIVDAIAEAKENNEENFTIKQMEKTKKSLEAKIQRLYDTKKDDTVFFEELGVDRLFVDEAHGFKNLYMHTKMRNVAGISQTDAQKSSDMYAKCRYMDEITGGRGVTFATGTPVSNSMVELYTMMRYLQYDMLEQGYEDSTGKVRSLKHFDNWAATFGEQVTAVELKPEGTGFRLKTRFARFYNLPELISRWKEAADIQTADMLKLPVPEAEYITIQTEPSEAQKMMVKGLADRAEKIRKERIDPRLDNMLKVTSDGRKLALDQRIMNPLIPDDPGSKVNACVDNVFQIWQESTPQKGTQLIFSDLSTPKGRAENGSARKNAQETSADAENGQTGEETAMEASVYEDIRKKLIAKGIPEEQVAFIHSANTEAQKAELFAKVRSGQVRVLLGSTQKMGAGTNVQTKLVASHDLDCPWRPADLNQRAGRIVRRGNENDHVKIFRYVTKGTFDAYTWGLVESKQKFIGQVMTSKSPARSIEDVDAAALSYAEVKMLATGDTRIKEKMDLDIQVTKLKMLKSNHLAQQYEMQDKVRVYFPNKIKETQLYIDCLNADLPILEAHPAKEDNFSMTVMETVYTERKEAGKAIIAACRLMDDPGKEIELGEYRGFPMKLCFDGAKFKVTMKQNLTHTAELSDDAPGNIARINNALEKIPESFERHRENLAQLQRELESAKEEADQPFAQEAELAEKSARLAELNTALDQTENGGDSPAAETEQPQENGGQHRQDNARGISVQQGGGNTSLHGEKSSILKTIREYQQPTPVHQAPERGREGR